MKQPGTTPLRWRNATTLRVVIFFVILILGTIGWERSAPPGLPSYDVWDSLYRALQLFVLGYDHPESVTWHPCSLLNIIRFVAPGFLAIAIITRVSKYVQNALIYVWNFGWRGRSQYLIIGYGRIGQGIATALQAKGARVVAVDHRVTPLDQQSALLSGIELYEADAQDLNSFRNVPVRLQAMQRLFVSVNDDQQTIATAASLAERIGKNNGSVWMQLNDWTLLDRLRNSSVLAEEDKAAQRKIRSFSMAEALGTQLIAKYRPALMVAEFGQNRLHAVLVRFDDFVWAMAEALILNGTTPPPRLARPRLTIIDAKAKALAARWWARHPYLHMWADVSFESVDPSKLAWSADEDFLTRIETLDPPTLYIFGRSGDGDSLSDALALRHGMEKGVRQPAPVFLTTEVQGVHMFGLRENQENLQDRLHVIGDDSETVTYSHVVDPWFEWVALRFFKNYAFEEIEVDDETAKRAYEAEPETKQVSNRRAAVHALQILTWLGFEQVKATEPYFGLNGKAVQEFARLLNHTLPNQTYTYRNRWALYEHIRWCVDRAIDGWRQGARDDEARFRDQMERGRYDYEKLSQRNKDLDYKHPDGLINLLNDPLPPLNDPDPLWIRHDETKDFVRIIDHETPIVLQWHFTDGVLSLQLPENLHWPKPAESLGLHKRIRLLVPSEPKLGYLPSEQKLLRLAAYHSFIATLPDSPSLHFRFMRVRGEGWDWLPTDSNGTVTSFPARIDGCTLPPLTIGFAGTRNLEPFGGEAAVLALVNETVCAVLHEQSKFGRPLRLITGVAKGSDQIMIKIWRSFAAQQEYPIVALIPSKSCAQDDMYSGIRVSELLLLGAPEDYANLKKARLASESIKDSSFFVEISERILNSCDLLIAVYDESAAVKDGGTKQTIKNAEFLGIETVRVLLATAGRN